MTETRTEPAEPHEPGSHRLWGESWYFDFATRDGSVGGFARVGDYPNLGRRWWWAYLVTGSRAVGCALDRPLTGHRGSPWRLDDPALRLAIDPVPGGWRVSAAGDGFTMDVTWRGQLPVYPYVRGNRLEQAGWATGGATVDGDPLQVDGPGQRDHSWSVRDWWRLGWTWCSGWLADGTRFHATQLHARGRIEPDGYLVAPGRAAVPVRDVTVRPDAVRMNDTVVEFADIGHTTLVLPAPHGGLTRLRRAMTRTRTAAGQTGIGWRELNTPERTPR